MSRGFLPARPGETVNDGVRLYRAGQFADAYRCYERVLKREPRNAMALWYIGRTLLKLSQPQRSIPFLRQAAEARPEAPEPRFDLGMAYLGVNRPEDAVERLRAAITLKPGWAEAWSYLGYAQSVA